MCDHALTGEWIGRRELHITPDWLLIYKIALEKIYLAIDVGEIKLIKIPAQDMLNGIKIMTNQ